MTARTTTMVGMRSGARFVVTEAPHRFTDLFMVAHQNGGPCLLVEGYNYDDENEHATAALWLRPDEVEWWL